jgi:hypothetical protein
MQQLTSEVDARITKLNLGLKTPRKRDKIYAEVDSVILKSLNAYEYSMDQEFYKPGDFNSVTEKVLDKLSYQLLRLNAKGGFSKKSRVIVFKFSM